MHKIFALLCNYNIISERTYHAVLQKLVISEISQGTILVSPEYPQEMVYFIGEGITRNFYSHQDQQWTHGFDVAGDCIMTSANFIDDEISLDYVETCTDVELYSIKKSDFQALMLMHPDLEMVSQKILERRLIRFEKRMQDLYTLKEEELYFKFKRDYPAIFNQVEDEHIASYLRMSTAVFSKLKKKAYTERKSGITV
jgi:CRP-like cAMP-binding protein